MDIYKHLINAKQNNLTHPIIYTTENRKNRAKVVASKVFVSFSNHRKSLFLASTVTVITNSISLYLSTKTEYVTMWIFWLLAVHACSCVCVTTRAQGLPDVLIVERADEILTRQTENKSCQPRN